MSTNDTNLLLVLRSLKECLNAFVSDRLIQSLARDNDKLAEVVERARFLRNLTETTCREINPDWRED